MFVSSDKLIKILKEFIKDNCLHDKSDIIPFGMERRIDINTRTIVLAEKGTPLPLHQRPYSYEWYMALIELNAEVEDVDIALDYNPRRNLFRFVERDDAPTSKNAILDMKKSKQSNITKNGQFYSKIAENYSTKIKKYSDFSTDKMAEKWDQEIDTIINAAGEESDEFLINTLDCYEEAGKIMKRLISITSDEIVDLMGRLFDLDRNLPLTSWLVTRYSPYALEFIETVFDDKILDDLPDIADLYLEKLDEFESKQPKNEGPIILQFPGTQPTIQ